MVRIARAELLREDMYLKAADRRDESCKSNEQTLERTNMLKTAQRPLGMHIVTIVCLLCVYIDTGNVYMPDSVCMNSMRSIVYIYTLHIQ